MWTVTSAARLGYSRQVLAVVSEGGIVCERVKLHVPVEGKVIRLLPVVTHCGAEYELLIVGCRYRSREVVVDRNKPREAEDVILCMARLMTKEARAFLTP